MAAVYGAGVLSIFNFADYETFVGLWMNRDRAGTRQAYSVLKAIRAAMPGGGPMNRDWFESLSESADQATAEFNRHQEMNRAGL